MEVNKTAQNDTFNVGRVSDFTLENFFYNIWMNIAIVLLIIGFFTFYRRFRGDDLTLKLKLKEKSLGSKEKFKKEGDDKLVTETSNETIDN